jgi:hypothetical protein
MALAPLLVALAQALAPRKCIFEMVILWKE